MGLFDDRDDDSTSIMGRLAIERNGGSVRDLGTGGCVVERPSYGGMSTFDRHDALGTKIDEDRGFTPRW